jgi:hypothetical protein
VAEAMSLPLEDLADALTWTTAIEMVTVMAG